MDGSFERTGPAAPASPVVLSVPHAGRDYPLSLRAAARVPVAAMRALEDRYVDLVAARARKSETLIVQRRARAWIDLNRSERERDPAVDEGASLAGQPMRSTKLRSGLGLVPRRAGPAGELWRRRFSGDEIEARIATDHRPYHAALAEAIATARAAFGVAVLLDIHSMPPLGAADIVLGDRFGGSAASRFVTRLEAEGVREEFRVALNAPYAGGHILCRHGDPASAVHAIQIEIDRRLYLDAALDQPGPGLPLVAERLRRMIAAITDEAIGGGALLAAE